MCICLCLCTRWSTYLCLSVSLYISCSTHVCLSVLIYTSWSTHMFFCVPIYKLECCQGISCVSAAHRVWRTRFTETSHKRGRRAQKNCRKANAKKAVGAEDRRIAAVERRLQAAKDAVEAEGGRLPAKERRITPESCQRSNGGWRLAFTSRQRENWAQKGQLALLEKQADRFGQS